MDEYYGVSRSGRFYMLVRTSTNYECACEDISIYAVDDNNSYDEKRVISGIDDAVAGFPRGLMTLSHGSKTYLLGGFNRPRRRGGHRYDRYEVNRYGHGAFNNEFWSLDFDISHVHGGSIRFNSDWVQGPNMLANRASAHGCVTLDSHNDKMYVFGGVLHDSPYPHNEVFDFKTGKWSGLELDFSYQFDIHKFNKTTENPLSRLSASAKYHFYATCATIWDKGDFNADGSKNIVILLLVPRSAYLYSYHVSSGVLQVFDEDFGGNWDGPLLLSCNNTILVCYDQLFDQTLCAYDLARKEWSEVKDFVGENLIPQLLFSEFNQPPLPYGISQYQLFSLGSGKTEKLCLLWTSRKTTEEPYRFHYTKFTITQKEDGFYAHLDPPQTFLIHGAHELVTCLNVEPHRKGVKRSRGDSEDVGGSICAEEDIMTET